MCETGEKGMSIGEGTGWQGTDCEGTGWQGTGSQGNGCEGNGERDEAWGEE